MPWLDGEPDSDGGDDDDGPGVDPIAARALEAANDPTVRKGVKVEAVSAGPLIKRRACVRGVRGRASASTPAAAPRGASLLRQAVPLHTHVSNARRLRTHAQLRCAGNNLARGTHRPSRTRGPFAPRVGAIPVFVPGRGVAL